MKTYKFEVDRKVTVWYRETHMIEAETMEQAEAIMIENADNDKMDKTFVYQDMLQETMEDTGDFEVLNPETKETIYTNLL